MPLIYATLDELTAWSAQDWPDNADAYLRIASGLVRQATRSSRYDVDTAGKASDPDVIEAFRDATCAQVDMWVDAGINPVSAGVGKTEPTVTSESKGMGGRTVSKSYADLSSSVTVASARSAAATSLCLESWTILSNAGLLGHQPAVR